MMFRWLRAQLDTLAGKRVRGLSLVANYLANVLWQVDNTWRSLMREGYGRNSVAYAALRLLSQSIPEARMRAYTGEDDKRKPLPNDHPLMALILRPNPLMTEFEMWELSTLQMAGGGRSCWWKERANGGQVLALWPLRPDRVGPIYSNDPASPVLAGWSYSTPDGTVVPLPISDVLTFNFPDPDGESGGIVEGLGPLSPGRADISADNMATQHMGALLANYAQPGIALKVQDAVDEDTAKLIKAKFRQEFGGRSVGTPAILDAGAEIEVLGFSLRDLEFTGLRADTESRICAVLGVPSIMVGVNSGLASSTYSNYETARLAFTESTLAFYWRRYSDQLTMDLAPEFGEGITCEFDTSKVKALAAQFEKQLAPWAAAFAASAITRNEYRAKLGLEPLPPKVGDVLFMPSSGADVGATEELIAADEEAAAELAEQMAEQTETGAAQPEDAEKSLKYNENHGEDGRFTAGHGGGGSAGASGAWSDLEASPNKVIGSFGELQEMASKETLYVRWSRGPKYDKGMTGSLDQASGERHAGLSAQRLHGDNPELMARMVPEYGYLRNKDPKIHPWVFKGDRVGTDSDGAALIDPKSIRFRGRISDKLVTGLDAVGSALAKRDDKYAHNPWKPEHHARNVALDNAVESAWAAVGQARKAVDPLLDEPEAEVEESEMVSGKAIIVPLDAEILAAIAATNGHGPA